jgi:hypothetical protein
MAGSAAAGLILKCAELQDQRNRLLGQLKAVDESLDTLRKAIRIMDPTAVMGNLSRSPTKQHRPIEEPPHFEHGEFSRLLMDAVRKAPDPFTSTVVAEAVAISKGGPEAGYRSPAILGKVSATLAGFVNRGAVQRVGSDPEGRTLYRVAA